MLWPSLQVQAEREEEFFFRCFMEVMPPVLLACNDEVVVAAGASTVPDDQGEARVRAAHSNNNTRWSCLQISATSLHTAS
jgi:hypothetical protein